MERTRPRHRASSSPGRSAAQEISDHGVEAGGVLHAHEMRAADYDDWITPTIEKNAHMIHGLHGDILVWNPVTKRRHELTSMGIRVTKDTMRAQLEISNQLDFLNIYLFS